MARQSTGELRKLATGWEARITIEGRTRKACILSTCTTEAEAVVRKEAMATMARRLRTAGHVDRVEKLLEMAASARAGRPWEAVEAAVNALCAGCVEDVAPVKTFAVFAKEWTSGELHRRFPDHVASKDAARDEELLELYINGTLGELAVNEITLSDVEQVMANLPEGKAPATRRHVAQVIRRTLGLAVYPGRLIAVSPIPRGWLPRLKDAKAKECLYPDEDLALVSHPDVPLLRRLAYGVLSREGLRTDELAKLRWSDLDLVRGHIKLDENKTDDPRDWDLDPGVVAALRVWKERYHADAEHADHAFAEHGVPINTDHLAAQLRRDLKAAGVTRAELYERTESRRPLRAHDLRATFITVSLANGKTETWISDRTGHRSSGMINVYRRKSRTWSGMALGALAPLNGCIPELGPLPHALPHEHPARVAKLADAADLGSERASEGSADPNDGAKLAVTRGGHDAPPTEPVGQSSGNESTPRGSAIAALYTHAAALAEAGDLSAARALHATISALLGTESTGAPGEVIDLASRKRGGR